MISKWLCKIDVSEMLSTLRCCAAELEKLGPCTLLIYRSGAGGSDCATGQDRNVPLQSWLHSHLLPKSSKKYGVIDPNNWSVPIL